MTRNLSLLLSSILYSTLRITFQVHSNTSRERPENYPPPVLFIEGLHPLQGIWRWTVQWRVSQGLNEWKDHKPVRQTKLKWKLPPKLFSRPWLSQCWAICAHRLEGAFSSFHYGEYMCVHKTQNKQKNPLITSFLKRTQPYFLLVMLMLSTKSLLWKLCSYQSLLTQVAQLT